jgi:AraC family cel operon transcriptional repressor
VPLHTHDFAEVFWIERGRGTHLINGRRVPLDAGCVVLMRPDDEHTFIGVGAQPLTLVNVAFDTDTLGHLRRRYFARPAPWPWAGDALPTMVRFNSVWIDELSAAAERLPATHQRQLDLDVFLLALLQRMSPVRHGGAAALPTWLHDAVESLRSEPDLSEGPLALARLADRSLDHVNRTVQRYLCKTATDLVNDIRLERAAERLRMTQRAIIQIADESGFNNLGYFYRVFTARYGVTPRRYRLAAQAVA